MTDSTKHHFWLRHETKKFEQRTALLPEQVKTLIDAGHQVTVEESESRCVGIDGYKEAGATIVPACEWKNAPKEALVVGLKELPSEDQWPIEHDSVYFAHVYKNQPGADELLTRFVSGGGTLYDIEFLQDPPHVRRGGSFSRAAGFNGMAVGLLQWAGQVKDSSYSHESLSTYDSSSHLTSAVKESLSQVPDGPPKIVVVGALGKCGRGAVEAALESGVPDDHITKWDMKETSGGGPFPQLLEFDILVNCIYLNVESKTPPFLTSEMIQSSSRVLSVLVDVSCDVSNPANPLPIYSNTTDFKNPSSHIISPSQSEHGRTLSVVAIDHLPSLVPKEASASFASEITESLLNFPNGPEWVFSKKTFEEKTQHLRSSTNDEVEEPPTKKSRDD